MVDSTNGAAVKAAEKEAGDPAAAAAASAAAATRDAEILSVLPRSPTCFRFLFVSLSRLFGLAVSP